MTNIIVELTCRCHKGQVYVVDKNSIIVYSFGKNMQIGCNLSSFPWKIVAELDLANLLCYTLDNE